MGRWPVKERKSYEPIRKYFFHQNKWLKTSTQEKNFYCYFTWIETSKNPNT